VLQCEKWRVAMAEVVATEALVRVGHSTGIGMSSSSALSSLSPLPFYSRGGSSVENRPQLRPHWKLRESYRQRPTSMYTMGSLELTVVY